MNLTLVRKLFGIDHEKVVKGAVYNVETMYTQQSYCIYRRGTVKIAGHYIYPRGSVCGRTLYTVGYLMYQWGTVYGVTRWCM